ncbi:MAG: TraR/DksA family transcriptional regulator [Pseudomonadota bacterium]
MPLDADNVEKFRALLNARMDELQNLSDGAADARKAVELDQQVMGRLSRQDALQQQAMAKAQEARRSAELKRLAAALARINEGEFGWCADCGEAIAQKRLEIDPAAELCVRCASGG